MKTFADLSAAELYAVMKARQEVFIVEQNCQYQDADGYDERALHLWALENDEIIAYCRIFPPNIKYSEASFGRVLTTRAGRGRGVGKILVRCAIDIVENRFRTSAITISAQDYLLKFYGGFGFEPTEKKYFEDEIPHTEMRRY